MEEAQCWWSGGTTTLKNKLVMIAGATGFIGSHLVAAAPAGYEVLTPSHEDIERGHIPTAHIIIHAAGYGTPSVFMKRPIDTIDVNVATTIRLMSYLSLNGTFLFCSSSEVYRGLTHAANEGEIGTTNPYHSRAAYIEGKRCGETIVNSYRINGFRAMSARIGLTYGPHTRKHDARVMNQFIEQALTKHKIELVDDGQAEVDYGYGRDTAKMLWNIVLHGTQPVYNVGGVCRVSIKQLAKYIAGKIGAEVVIPPSPAGFSQAKMDLSQYFTEFGRPNYTSWDEGLGATIAYQRGLYGIV